MTSKKVAEILYRGNKDLHFVKPNKKVFIFVHQTHPYEEGEPHTNSFNLTTYPYPDDVETRDELLAELYQRRHNLSGYSRILLAEVVF